MASTTPRVDINKALVTKAKQAMMLRQQGRIASDEKELEKIPFSTTLSFATDQYANQIADLLRQAGFRKHPPLTTSERRPRRVDSVVWEQLAAISEEKGVARMEFVRALFVLLGDEVDRWQASQSGDATTKDDAKSPDPVRGEAEMPPTS
jgi:hypothetical protein